MNIYIFIKENIFKMFNSVTDVLLNILKSRAFTNNETVAASE